MHSTPERPRGFTLIEVLFAVLIIGILAEMVAIQFSRYRMDLALKQTANDFYQLALFAQEKAVLDRRGVKIEIDFNRKTYRLLEEIPAEPGPFSEGPQFQPPPGRYGREEKFEDGIGGSGSAAEIRCFPDGGCRPGVWRFAQADGAAFEVILSENPSLVELRKIAP